MKEQIDLSLSIVTYNNELIIKETLLNIIQNIPNDISYNLYIIDNNSSDSTLEIAKSIKGEINIIPLKVNGGFGKGHNEIIKQLNSKFHAVVNPDITIEEDQVTRMINYMETNKDVGLLSPLILNKDNTIQYLCKKNPTVFDMLIRRISPNLFPQRQERYVLKNTGYDNEMQIEYATGCFMLFRTNIFLEVKGFDEEFFMYLEDADITRRVNEISKTMFYPNANVVHAWERGAHKSLKLAWITAKSMKVYFKKWGWKFY